MRAGPASILEPHWFGYSWTQEDTRALWAVRIRSPFRVTIQEHSCRVVLLATWELSGASASPVMPSRTTTARVSYLPPTSTVTRVWPSRAYIGDSMATDCALRSRSRAFVLSCVRQVTAVV